MKNIRWLIRLALAVAVVAMALPCGAQNGADATNAVNAVAGIATYASSIGTPIMIGLAGLFLAVGLIVAFVRRGKSGR